MSAGPSLQMEKLYPKSDEEFKRLNLQGLGLGRGTGVGAGGDEPQQEDLTVVVVEPETAKLAERLQYARECGLPVTTKSRVAHSIMGNTRLRTEDKQVVLAGGNRGQQYTQSQAQSQGEHQWAQG